MMYPRPRRAPKQKQPQQLPPAGLALIAAGEGFHDMPLGGWAGEFTAPRNDPAPPQPGPGLQIEPPPWAGQPAVAPPPPVTVPVENLGAMALQELKEKAGDVDEPKYQFGPPVVSEPLRQVVIPEWSEEERRAEQLARERAEQGILEEQPQRHPAPPRRDAP